MVNSSTSKLILAFVLLIIGIVFISQIAILGQDVTSEKTISDESISIASTYANTTVPVDNGDALTVTNAPTGWKSTDCPLTNVVITNSSGSTWTSGTDYVFVASAGTFTLRNTVTVNTTYSLGDNLTYVDYTYCGDDYINSSWGRTAVNLVPGFFALALLLISVGLFYNVAKEEGII